MQQQRGPVSFVIPPSAVRTISSRELENGASDLIGSLGDGTGKWSLFATIDGGNTWLLNLLESTTGHVTNLSTTPGDANTLELP